MAPNFRVRSTVAIVAVAMTTLLGMAGCGVASGTPGGTARSASQTPAGLGGVVGTWDGTYSCGQGLTGLRLTVTSAGGSSLAATWYFFPVPANPTVPQGEIKMVGNVSGDQVTLTHTVWVLQPAGYVMTDLSAPLPPKDSNVFAGTVVGPSCSTFNLHRSGSGASADATCTADALVTRHEGNHPHMYYDNATPKNPTVGIGFNLNRPDAPDALKAVEADYAAVRAGTQDLTAQQIDKLFAPDMAAARRQAAKYFPDLSTLTKARQDVLIDMAFNLNSKLSGFVDLNTALASSDYTAATIEMLNSDWARQTKTRAVEDANMMLTGSYTTSRCGL